MAASIGSAEVRAPGIVERPRVVAGVGCSSVRFGSSVSVPVRASTETAARNEEHDQKEGKEQSSNRRHAASYRKTHAQRAARRNQHLLVGRLGNLSLPAASVIASAENAGDQGANITHRCGAPLEFVGFPRSCAMISALASPCAPTSSEGADPV